MTRRRRLGFIPYGSTESTESRELLPGEVVNVSFIPYGSTESTESQPSRTELLTFALVSSHTARPRALKEKTGRWRDFLAFSFIPYGSTESTERAPIPFGQRDDGEFHPIRLDREH